ncbi:MAG: ABC transporter substrate-binding protein [Geminicoccaceae bacterium]
MTDERKLVGVSRREVMAGAAGVALAAAAPWRRAAAQTPKKGGDLKLGIDGAESTDSLDPASYTATYMQTVGYQWGNPLIELDVNNKPIPELAESWEPNKDATRWVVKLRKGVTFHNGKEMTADDVVASYNHHRGKDSKSAAKVYLDPFTDIKADGKDQVVFELAQGIADVPYILADYHLLIMPAGSPPDSGMGTGPFSIEAFEPGVRTLAKRNPNYFKDGRAHADSVETLAINDQTARTNALQTGAAHWINRVDPKTVSLLQRLPTIKIIDVPSAGHYLFVMRCDMAPFDNLDLRLAMKYGIDREDIIKKILLGHGALGNDNPIPGFDPFHADIPQRTYDLDKAKFHFKKSGFEGAVPMQIADAAFTGAVDTATLYQQHLAKAGINLDVQRVPNDGYWDNVWMKAPFCGSYWGGRPTADLMLSVAYASDAAWNESFWKRPDFDKLLVAARGELDQGKRTQLYAEAQTMINEDGGAIIPMFNNFLFGTSDKVAGMVTSPVLTGLRCAEQLYFV